MPKRSDDDATSKSYNGAQPYEGTQRAVEVRRNHSASYDGVYRSDGRFANDLRDEEDRRA